MARARGVAAATQTQDQPEAGSGQLVEDAAQTVEDTPPAGAVLDVEAWVADVWEHVHNGGPGPARRYLEQ